MSKLDRHGSKIKKNNYTCNEIKAIKKDLTVNPKTFNDFNTKIEKNFTLFLESPKKLYLPRFYAQDTLGPPTENNLTKGNPINLTFNGSLRKEQIPIFDTYIGSAEKKGGGIISLQCGGGKTVLTLAIIAILGLKTSVVVHKDFLMTQWRDRIREFLPDARIGKIQQDTIDIDNKDIVLAMVQSLSMKEYEDDTFSTFGLAVFDECHHLGAEVFCRSLPKVATHYMLGLSATPNRKDGLRKVFEWYLGPIVYQSKNKNTDYIEVKVYEYSHDSILYNKEELLYNGKQCFPRMINNICSFEPRKQFINKLIKDIHLEGRKLLILSDRREYLSTTLEWINTNICPAGLYIGGLKPYELRESQEKDIILGTFSMASEGMDIPKLNTIILASPKSDVVQSVGRIMREKAEKRKFHPLIIDIRDCHPNLTCFEKQSDKRITFYKKQNYTIHKYNLDGSVIKIEKTKRKKKQEYFETTEYLLE